MVFEVFCFLLYPATFVFGNTPYVYTTLILIAIVCELSDGASAFLQSYHSLHTTLYLFQHLSPYVQEIFLINNRKSTHKIRIMEMNKMLGKDYNS